VIAGEFINILQVVTFETLTPILVQGFSEALPTEGILDKEEE
jgi:hypothetical protein